MYFVAWTLAGHLSPVLRHFQLSLSCAAPFAFRGVEPSLLVRGASWTYVLPKGVCSSDRFLVLFLGSDPCSCSGSRSGRPFGLWVRTHTSLRGFACHHQSYQLWIVNSIMVLHLLQGLSLLVAIPSFCPFHLDLFSRLAKYLTVRGTKYPSPASFLL